jgi:hypothetical protein
VEGSEPVSSLLSWLAGSKCWALAERQVRWGALHRFVLPQVWVGLAGVGEG